MGPDVDIVVTYLTGSADVAKQVKHIFKYTSGPAYLKNGEAAVAV
jgi:hypothetical protein